MKVRVARLARQLQNVGFAHQTEALLSGIGFVRFSVDGRTSELVKVDWRGRRDEAVVARVGVGVTKCVATGGLMEDKLILEVAEVKERGWTIIETDEAARAWEEKLVQVAPPMAAAFAAERGSEILRNTESARAAAARYLSKIYAVAGPDERLEALKQVAGPEVIAEAERLAGWPGVLHLRGAEDTYLVACLAIASFAAEVEADGRTFVGSDPLMERPLMWRIQLIADELLYAKRLIRDGCTWVG